jgi:predicted short-subunit dehydrogenase-like oxidoreductase (DUF2520 family)
MPPTRSRKARAEPGRKPEITIVGAGNLGSALARELHHAGYSIDRILASRRPGSLRRARALAATVHASTALTHDAGSLSDVVWFCVPDGQIEAAAASLQKADWQGKVALHSSGALTSDALAILRGQGAAVASVHPLMTLVPKSRPALHGVSFALEGDRKATRIGRALVSHLRGQAFSIKKEHKAAYHAWGMFVSPLITALLATSEQVASAAGVPAVPARQRALPIVLQTVKNYAALGPAAGFSGPLVRGDAAVVQRHLDALRATPSARAVYVALIDAALEYLPAKNSRAIKKALRRS